MNVLVSLRSVKKICYNNIVGARISVRVRTRTPI